MGLAKVSRVEDNHNAPSPVTSREVGMPEWIRRGEPENAIDEVGDGGVAEVLPCRVVFGLVAQMSAQNRHSQPRSALVLAGVRTHGQ